MSMYADLINTMNSAKDDYGLEEDQVVELFIAILDCIEWRLDNIDYQRDDWQEQEREVARRELRL